MSDEEGRGVGGEGREGHAMTLLDIIIGEDSFSHSDVLTWYRRHNGVCPRCGHDLKKLPPEANLFPHCAGGCDMETGKISQ